MALAAEKLPADGGEPSPAQTRLTALYALLAAEFDTTFHDNRGGAEFEYVTGEQVTSRLNDVLGFWAWSFEVVEHGINSDADECWVRGRLSVTLPVLDAYGAPITLLREQFGSQKIKRGRTNQLPLDIGFDLKGAGTDALKKCATLIGVGLYLSKKESAALASQPRATATETLTGTPTQRLPGRPAPATDSTACEECGTELTETNFKDGTVWSPTQLAGYGRRKHGRVLCMEHYRAANQARNAAVAGRA